jgi:hypothetical protein
VMGYCWCSRFYDTYSLSGLGMGAAGKAVNLGG